MDDTSQDIRADIDSYFADIPDIPTFRDENEGWRSTRAQILRIQNPSSGARGDPNIYADPFFNNSPYLFNYEADGTPMRTSSGRLRLTDSRRDSDSVPGGSLLELWAGEMRALSDKEMSEGLSPQEEELLRAYQDYFTGRTGFQDGGVVDTPGFFSREAGQARRAALNDFLNENADYYLGPTGIPDRLRALGEFLNPVAAMEDASTAAVRAADPDLPARERLGALGESALNVGLFGIPGALAYRGYLPTAEALAETLTGIGAASPEVQDVVRATVERLNQPGPMPTLYSNPLPGVGHNGGPPLDAEPEPARLRSRLMMALDQIGQPRGTYEQLRQRLISLGGGAPAERELAFTGMDRMFNPDDRVTLDELRNYLEGTTDMFESPTSVASGTTGDYDAGDMYVRRAAYERYEENAQNDGTADAIFGRFLDQVTDQYPDLPEDQAIEIAQQAADDEFLTLFSSMSDDEILDLAGIERFDPGGTQYSSYMTPGLRDYFETEYRFADPGQIYPLGPRNVPGFGAHDFGNPESGFMHVRGAQSVDGMGGSGNTWLMGELQSDVGQTLRSQGTAAVPTNPDFEAALLLSDSGTGRDLPEEVWERIQDPSFDALGDNFFTRRLVLNPDFTTPRAEDFTRAVTSAQTQAQDYLRRGGDDVRRMREDLDAEGQEAMRILHEGLEVEGSYLGYDSASGAMADISRTIRGAEYTGQDAVEFVQGVYDIDPTRSEREQFLSEALRRYVDHPYMSADRQTRVRRMRDLSESVGRYLGRVFGDQTEIDYLRRLTDVDAPPSLVRRIEEGEVLSPDELDRVYAEEGPVAAAALAARNEFGLRNINPNALRDISGFGTVYRSSTHTPMPFTESTNQWVDYGLRNQLLEAANAGREYFAISNPEMVRRMTYGTEEGQSDFYGSIVPQRLRNIVRGLDKNAPSTTSADEFRDNPNMVFGPGQIDTANGPQDVIMVRLTPELRARIRGDEGFRGLTTFLRPEAAVGGSGLASLALMGEEEDTDNY